jgi:nucleoside-diphosphate kinase
MQQKTLLILKPDCVKRGLIGEVTTRFEKVGLKIVAMKMAMATREQLEKHYPLSDQNWISKVGQKSLNNFVENGLDVQKYLGSEDTLVIGTKIVNNLVEFMLHSPVVILCLEGPDSVAMCRKLIGSTLPCNSSLGSIRGDYSLDNPMLASIQNRPIFNLIHGSETVQDAQKELRIWFPEQDFANFDFSETIYTRNY